MTKTTCFKFCRRAKESGEPRLSPGQLSRLLGDTQVREALQDVGVASLLPPVGAEVFRRLTVESLQEAEQRAARQTEDHHLVKPAAQLKEGEPLPFFYGAPPPKLRSVPLEELDPYYQSQKTFVALSRGNILHRFDADKSLYLLDPLHGLRTFSIKILLSPWFQWFILFTLLLNCLFMVLDQTVLTEVMDWVFLIIYSSEVLLKVLSQGFCLGRFSFIRDPWNWLDLLVIVTSVLALFLDLGRFSVFVTIPRILKIFSASPGLKKTVEALVQLLRRLAYVTFVAALCLAALAVASLHLFMGSHRRKCIRILPNFTDTLDFYDYDFEPEHNSARNAYRDYILNPNNQFHRPNENSPLMCGNKTSAGSCPDGFFCLSAGKNPHYGYTSYDSFFWSLLSMFRFLTQDFWENLFHTMERTAGLEASLFLLLVVFPTFFLVHSLVLAVVAMVTADQDQAAAEGKKRREEELWRIEEALARRTKDDDGEEVRGASSEKEEGDGSVKVAVMGSSEVDAGAAPPPSCWQRFRFRLRHLVLHPLFDLGVAACLVVNIIVMATEHYPMTAQQVHLLSVLELVFVLIWTLELLLRLLVLGPKGFFQVSWHILDLLVVLGSLVEIVLVNLEGASLVRCLQLLRMFRLARWWPSFHMFLQLVRFSVRGLTLVLMVLVFMWTVVGLRLFQEDYLTNVCKIASDCMLPRWHMADWTHSAMTVCRVLYGEIMELLWDCMEVSGPGTCVTYFIPMLVFGKLLVLVLFLQVLLNSTIKEKLEVLEDRRKDAPSRKVTQMCRRSGQNQRTDPDQTTEVVSLNPITSETTDVHQPPSTDPDHKDHQVDEENDKGHAPEDCCCRWCPLQDVYTSRGSWRTWSTFRKTCLLVVEHKVFEVFMLLVILLSCVALVFEDIHLEDNPTLKLVLDCADLVFTLVFLVEVLLKWAGLGFRKYFSDFYCWLDFLVLDVSLVALLLDVLGVYCRPLRTFRTLRTLSRFQGVRVVLRSLYLTLPHMVDAWLVVLFVWLAFAMVGVKLFAGKFSYCFNETSQEFILHEDVDNSSECLLLSTWMTGVNWKRAVFHFDSVAAGFLSLTILGTSSGILDFLYFASDTRGVDQQPAYEHNHYTSLYFLCFLVFGCYFSFLFFVRALVRALQKHRHQLGGKHLLVTENRLLHPEGFKKLLSRPWTCPLPQNCCQRGLFAVVSSRWFELFMLVMVSLNVACLGMNSFDASLEFQNSIGITYHILILVFLLELILKLVAFRQFYFMSVINIIDVVVLVFIIIAVFVPDLLWRYFTRVEMFVILRLFRVVRVLRFWDTTRKQQNLVLGFVMALPALVNVGMVLLVLIFTYAVAGMFAFGRTQSAFSLDDMTNFQTFWRSLVTLTTVTHKSSWDGLLMAVMKTHPECHPSEVRGYCGNPVAGVVFFASYVPLFSLLVVYLFIVVVLESFNARDPEDSVESKDPQNPQKSENPQNSPDPEVTPKNLSDKHLQMFYDTWEKFDPEDSKLIKYSDLSHLLDALQDPLRIPKPNGPQLSCLDLKLLPEDQVHCEDVLRALSAQVSGESNGGSEPRNHQEVAAAVSQ